MEFKTIKEFNKVYATMRDELLIKHGYKKGDKVILKNAVMLYQEFNGSWLKISSVKSDMVDRIKMQATFNIDAKYKLVAMV